MSDLLLAPGSHLIHIGPQKTGSTAIQNALHAARARLSEYQAHYAGEGSRAREAGWYILGGRAPVGRPAPRRERWIDLIDDVRSAGPETRVCVSNEDFARATPEQIRSIVDGLGGDEPHIVSVVRRLDKYLPSQWQERVKAREQRSYEDWLRVILADSHDDWQWNHVWYPHSVGNLVERWTDVIGKDRMTVIVADDQDRGLLPGTFEKMLGLPSGLLQVEDLRSNRSLSLNEAELVRAFNRHFMANGWPDWAYAQMVQGGLVKGLKQRPRPQAHVAGPTLPDWAAERVEELSRQQATALQTSGVRIVGNPETLVTPADSLRVRDRDTVVTVEVDLETAARALEGVVAKALKLQKRDEAKRRRLVKEARRQLMDGRGQTRTRQDAIATGLRRLKARLAAR